MKFMSVFSFASMTMLAIMATSGSGARAEDTPANDGFNKRLFAGDVVKGKKSYVCFARKYDAAHLAQHPLQKVSAMKLLVTAETEPEDGTRITSFRLGLNFRNKTGNFDSSGDCHHPEASEITDDKFDLGCGVDCDGGGITLALTNGDKSALVKPDNIRIWRNNRPEADPVSLSSGKDDRVFRLDRTSLEDCRSLVSDRKELAAMRRK